MNRREFLQSLLGATAVAALPTAVLAAAEAEVAPLADSVQSWTTSNYFFSVFVKREHIKTFSTIMGSNGSLLTIEKPMWERIGFSISQELGDALSSDQSMCSGAGTQVLERVLKIINQDAADFQMAQLERLPYSPTFSSLQFAEEPYALPYNGIRRVQNKLPRSERFE